MAYLRNGSIESGASGLAHADPTAPEAGADRPHCPFSPHCSTSHNAVERDRLDLVRAAPIWLHFGPIRSERTPFTRHSAWAHRPVGNERRFATAAAIETPPEHRPYVGYRYDLLCSQQPPSGEAVVLHVPMDGTYERLYLLTAVAWITPDGPFAERSRTPQGSLAIRYDLAGEDRLGERDDEAHRCGALLLGQPQPTPRTGRHSLLEDESWRSQLARAHALKSGPPRRTWQQVSSIMGLTDRQIRRWREREAEEFLGRTSE
jgi:hypothetical protein